MDVQKKLAQQTFPQYKAKIDVVSAYFHSSGKGIDGAGRQEVKYQANNNGLCVINVADY